MINIEIYNSKKASTSSASHSARVVRLSLSKPKLQTLFPFAVLPFTNVLIQGSKNKHYQ
jgi:hypothetical protein